MRADEPRFKNKTVLNLFQTADWVKPHVPGWARTRFGHRLDTNALGSILFDIENKQLCNLNRAEDIQFIAMQLYNIKATQRMRLLTRDSRNIRFLLKQSTEMFNSLESYSDAQLHTIQAIGLDHLSEIKKHTPDDTAVLLAQKVEDAATLIKATHRTRREVLRRPDLIHCFCMLYRTRQSSHPREDSFTSYIRAEMVIDKALFSGYHPAALDQHIKWFARLDGEAITQYNRLSGPHIEHINSANAWQMSLELGPQHCANLLALTQTHDLCASDDWETQQKFVTILHALDADERTKLFGLDFDNRTLLEILSLPMKEMHRLLQQEGAGIQDAVTLLNAHTEYGTAESKSDSDATPKNAWQLIHRLSDDRSDYYGFDEAMRRLEQTAELAHIHRLKIQAASLDSGYKLPLGFRLGGRGAAYMWAPAGIVDICNKFEGVKLPESYPINDDDTDKVDRSMLTARSILTTTASRRLACDDSHRDEMVHKLYLAIRDTWPDLTSAPSPTSELSSDEEDFSRGYTASPPPMQ